jgi:hypothetical protein
MQTIEADQEPTFWAERESPEDPWTIAYGFMGKGGDLVLAEIRIFPTRPADRRNRRRTLGDWSRDPKLVPDPGLPARVLRQIKLREALGVALGSVLPSDMPAGNAGHFAVRADRAAPKPSKPRRDPRLLAKVATLYDEGMRQHSTAPAPSKYVWEHLKGTEHQFDKRSIEGLVREARQAGYLTPATKGRAGGRATRAARELWPESDEK